MLVSPQQKLFAIHRESILIQALWFHAVVETLNYEGVSAMLPVPIHTSCTIFAKILFVKSNFSKIAKGMREQGSDKTETQCRAKMKKLKLDYRKIKDKHRKTERGCSTGKFLDALDTVLGHKAATKSPLVLDTSEDHAEHDESDDGAEVEDNDLSAVDKSFSSPTAATTSTTSASTSNAEDSTNNEHLARASKQAPSTSGTSIKGKKKKRTRDERIEGALQTVIKDVVEAQQKSDKMFLEWEEKRMKFEAEQRKEKCGFQLRMMSMLLGSQRSLSIPSSHPTYNDYVEHDEYDI